MNGGLFFQNVLQSIDIVAKVWVGTDSSAASGITQSLEAGLARHLEATGEGDIRELKVKNEDNLAGLLTKFLDSERHHKLFKLLPLSVRVTRRSMAYSVARVGVTAGSNDEE